MAGIMRNFVKHVDEVKKEDSMGGDSVMRKVVIDE
jgi:hypothetical protein